MGLNAGTRVRCIPPGLINYNTDSFGNESKNSLITAASVHPGRGEAKHTQSVRALSTQQEILEEESPAQGGGFISIRNGIPCYVPDQSDI